ncbi:MAG: GNAT family N-acetyltransferase [Solobacterium sp.]|nr:GNAT family N-acetyltransferase [Solobacterium sp.]
MRIEAITGTEYYDAENLIKEVFFSSGNRALSSVRAKDYLENLSAKGRTLKYLGAYEEGLLEAVIGYGDLYTIRYFAVRKEKEELAEPLFQALIKQAEQENAARITAYALSSERSFYETLGFEVISESEVVTELEYLLQKEWLGKEVTVTIDRPYGSFHPHYPDTQYPCNYGYVEEVLAKDGEFQDAYVCGVYEPLETFRGIVSAIIYRRNDVETKWVVTSGNDLSEQEVIDSVGEIEQYFDTRILWLKDKNERKH